MTLAEVLWNGTFTILVWGRYCRIKSMMYKTGKNYENKGDNK